jgi:hypothetical protein
MQLLLALPSTLQAQFTFTTNNGAVTITGYTGSNGAVVIPSSTNGWPVTSIGESAFINCVSMTNVTLPNSLTNIGSQAFTGSGLASVVLPDSLISIGPSAFLNCYSLAGLVLGEGVSSIGDYAFSGCSSLTNVLIPESLTNISSTAFIECSSLTALTADGWNPTYSSLAGVLFDKTQTTVVRYPGGLGASYAIPGTVTAIGPYAFSFCHTLTNILLPESVIDIGQSAFLGCDNVTQFAIPTNIITIEAGAFAQCANLTLLVLSESLLSLGAGAFSQTALASVLIPGSVTNIGPGAFGYCLRLTAINVETTNLAYRSVAGVLYDFSLTTLVEYPPGTPGGYFRLGSCVIPSGVITIGDEAFLGAWCLTNITLPASVTSIGSEAFQSCSRLVQLTVPDNVTNIGNGAFDATALTSITFPASLTTLGWLSYCPSLQSLYFEGNAPGQGSGIPLLAYFRNATAYYLPGTSGWGTYFQTYNLPTALWLPQMQSSGGQFGVQTNQFGFNVCWASGRPVVVEACADLANSAWVPLQTNTLTGSAFYFSDPQWLNYPRRFYRIRSP